MTRHETTQTTSPMSSTPANASVEADLLRAALGGGLSRRELLRQGRRAGLGFGSLATLAALAAAAVTPGTTEARKTGESIPPNCIFVCCDGTCDSWKMCMSCVQWPKATTTVSRS